ncbi:PREDICTED: profilin-like [Tarenaya hassleriana]|uniref:profilin-like n=1 Tax=Tarenaya hassleriana TaxID=28532 RepID=UPI00053C0C35|nr:PREDICTED: profilin-like [Tarenaya hassleriana]
MTWQTYVDDHLICATWKATASPRPPSSAKIGSLWAQSSTVSQFKPEEITGIVDEFKEPGTLAKRTWWCSHQEDHEPMAPGQCNMVMERL